MEDGSVRRWLPAMLLSLPLVLTSGCVTHTLWTSSKLDNWNEPAPKSNVRLYATCPPQDFLVVYDELPGRHDTARTRAYFLYQNQARMTQQCAPHFVSTNLIRSLEPVPVFCLQPSFGTNEPPASFAVTGTNRASFTLYQGTNDPQFFHLPVYNDGTGKYKRAALTPLTVTADVGIVASVVGVFVLYSAATSP